MALIKPVKIEPIADLGKIHFIGVGGSGMSGIAQMYAELGVAVSGSDRQSSSTLDKLASYGVETFVGQEEGNIAGAQTVVYSTAIRETNPELSAARKSGLRVWHRSAALAALMVGKRVVSVTGTHGKTTTTGMLATMFSAAKADPSYVVGSPLAATGARAGIGSSDFFVVEADESDGSFMQYETEIAIITNVESDHLVNWGTTENYREGFYTFANQPSVRVVIVNVDDAGAADLAARLKAEGKVKVLSYGIAETADYQLKNIELRGGKSTAILTGAGVKAQINLGIPGVHNLLNAAAAYLAGLECGLDSTDLLAGASQFKGTLRRFQLIDEIDGVRIYDDYGHLPTEIKAALDTARLVADGGRVVACHQPFLYSRTTEYADEFGQALTNADLIVLTDIMGAREDPVPGVTGEVVVDTAKAHGGQVIYVENKLDLPAKLAEISQPGDLIVTLGIGDVSEVGPKLAKILREKSQAGED